MGRPQGVVESDLVAAGMGGDDSIALSIRDPVWGAGKESTACKHEPALARGSPRQKPTTRGRVHLLQYSQTKEINQKKINKMDSVN